MASEKINIQNCISENVTTNNNIVRLCQVCQECKFIGKNDPIVWKKYLACPGVDKNGFKTSGSLMRPIYSINHEAIRQAVTDTGVCCACVDKGNYILKAIRHRMLHACVKRLNTYLKTRPMLYKQFDS